MRAPTVHMKGQYSRNSMAQTLMGRLPRLFRTRSGVPKKNSHRCRFGILLGEFLFCIDSGMLCVLIRIASVLNKIEKKYPYDAT